ncbi:MAG: hypothetical protein COT71_03210 [Candidatus Andersenbacteria bacterium CG10_big_fil_rev_8_21_14_0_10_54_11]|uniref:Metallo-beta-lactamase domain-containing protein n=1 Tax=Candidatus Andersenbacteria bacterium CG10_big_fil_rev_8_21_14_0_10_54_11 TaxID=1974485 RepID=A0A2M6WYT6_9BACT|nr:MAG: hypothetical protein COT71_03210 [Candidatus Andersenbacteria bacterium CG10_big_fil_rev_8_21_14_0_10_54_11]
MARQAYGLLAAAVLAIGVLVPGPADKVVFLDVGQGDAILLQDGTAQILIDGGKGVAVLSRLAEELPWFDRKIEVIIATHPDKDHLEGLVHVLEGYEVGLVLLPRVSKDSQLQQAWLERLQAAAENRRAAWRFAWAGEQVRAGGIVVSVLGPDAAAAAGEKTNNASVITRVDFCGGDNPSPFLLQRGGKAIPLLPPSPAGPAPLRPLKSGERASLSRDGHCLSFMLTGDAEALIERRLTAAYASAVPGDCILQTSGTLPTCAGNLLNVDVLKAGHHGSSTSTTAELLAAASPAAVVISVGAENSYGHPHRNVLARLAGFQLWRTDEHGSVRFLRGAAGWAVQTRRH